MVENLLGREKQKLAINKKFAREFAESWKSYIAPEKMKSEFVTNEKKNAGKVEFVTVWCHVLYQIGLIVNSALATTRFSLSSSTELNFTGRMAFQPAARLDTQNPQKKILEELNLRKQLLKSGTAQTLNPSALNSPIGVSINSNPGCENQSNFARVAHANNILQHANSTSFGYFIPQESSFGNNILAVFPRFNETK